MVKNVWKKIVNNRATFIIAEAGVNHNGSLKIAKELIDVAKQAGADAVKFQTFNTDSLISTNAVKAKYQQKATGHKESLYEMLKRLELNADHHRHLEAYARKREIIFLSTPFDNESGDLLNKLKMPLFKISSGDITNLPFLKYMAQKDKPLVLSTGRSTMKEVKDAVSTILKSGNKRLALLHCVSNYPANFDELNLKAMNALKREFNLPIGFSDHSLGIEASIAAVALGANIIEKHFTLDKRAGGPDHSGSLEPTELENLVTAVRHIESALGHGKKIPTRREQWGIKNVRKGLVSTVDIPGGTRLKREMIAIKRPATGIEPKYFNRIVGKMVRRNIKKNTPIQWDKIEGRR